MKNLQKLFPSMLAGVLGVGLALLIQNVDLIPDSDPKSACIEYRETDPGEDDAFGLIFYGPFADKAVVDFLLDEVAVTMGSGFETTIHYDHCHSEEDISIHHVRYEAASGSHHADVRDTNDPTSPETHHRTPSQGGA